MPAVQPDANQMAKERTDWALSRTIMALERTLMAWLRTALSLISFGFTIAKILEPIVEKGTVPSTYAHTPRNLAVFLISLGMGLLLVGIIEYRTAKKNLLAGSDKKVPFSFTFAASVGILGLGVFTILNIWFGIGGF